ncbi:anti-sigma factor family protein [Streptomyces poriticola]|uniref:anti-sigma factor family protein n=1 Tax=Streptomyces poriticola TaxID=3120506 RepID=UPI002FCE04C7
MTSSTADQTWHPDVAEISDLAEGLLPPSRSTDVRQHLDACGACADVHASLEEIRGLLGALPEPQPMPDDVADRLDAALAAEALSPDNTPAHVSRETSTAPDRPAGHARPSAAGPGRKDRKRGGRRRIAALGAVVAAAALGLGSVIVSALNEGGPSEEAQASRSAPADTFSENRLKDQVAALLAQSNGSRNGPRTPNGIGAESETGPENRIFTQPTVPACIQQGIGRNDTALVTEEGIYQGKPAMLVVLPDASEADRVTAYIVEATCVDHTTVATAKVLLEQSYPRS